MCVICLHGWNNGQKQQQVATLVIAAATTGKVCWQSCPISPLLGLSNQSPPSAMLALLLEDLQGLLEEGLCQIRVVHQQAMRAELSWPHSMHIW